MREIEFRAKHTHTNEFKYGFINYNKATNEYKVSDGGTISYFIDPNTIGQYTGRTDKNGTKMFESDIVKLICSSGDEYICFVDYIDCQFVLNIKDDSKLQGSQYLMRLSNSLNVEVIGNIYDNPELIGE